MSFFSFQLNSYVILGQLAYWGRIKSDEKTPLNEIQVVEEPAAQSTNGSPTMEEKPPASMRIEQTSLASIKYTHLLNRCARLFSVCVLLGFALITFTPASAFRFWFPTSYPSFL